MSEPKKKTGRGVKIALALSLAANLAVVGLVAGVAFGGDRAGGPPRLASLGLGPFAFAFEREDRHALRAALAEAGLQASRRELGGALREVQAAIAADPFDRAAAEEAFAQSRGLVTRLQELGHETLLDHIEEMSANARAELAENVGRALRRGLGGRSGDR